MPNFADALAKAAIAVSLCTVSAAANASVSSTPAAQSSANFVPAPSNQWLILSAMTTNSSAAANAADADQEDDRIGYPPIASLSVILATIATAVYILLRDDDGDLDLELPVSPS